MGHRIGRVLGLHRAPNFPMSGTSIIDATEAESVGLMKVRMFGTPISSKNALRLARPASAFDP
jgi:hypothetical protein